MGDSRRLIRFLVASHAAFALGYVAGIRGRPRAARFPVANEKILTCACPVRIREGGLYASQYWSTIYPWIASDVTLPGTVLVLGAIGWLAGLVWMDVLGGRNPFAVALLGQLLVLLYYIPAHNKVMQTGEGISAFAVLLGAWLFARGRE